MKDKYGRANAKAIKKLEKIAKTVEALEPKYEVMSDAELASQTQIFKDRYAAGETLDDLLAEAFAVCREASKRVLHQRHYHVQILGGIALHQGRICQMATGEGKTLTETLPAYLNAISGNGVHIITVNEYLANRDKEWMGQVFRFLGLTVGVTLSQQNWNDKRGAYACDITYGTNSEFGFDYLRDNMATERAHCVQRGLNFVIVDEVDSILIDEARTPLIISGPSNESSSLYYSANKFAASLKNSTNVDEEGKVKGDDDSPLSKLGRRFDRDEEQPNGDYVVDEKQKSVSLTDKGIAAAEAFFGVDNLSSPENVEINHYINNALRAHAIMHRDDDYIVEKGAVVIVDTFTGRKMEGRRFSDGLHQAIEAKEGVKVRSEDRTVATITIQNYFRLYHKLSGMTGTAKTEEQEFNAIYNLDVVAIPTNLPMIRDDRRDMFFSTRAGKLRAIVREIEERHKVGQPVLVGTKTVERSEELSKMLKEKGVPHTVLNAKYHKQEAEIIAQAGAVGAVTIATNMAGRGTDILLGGTPEALAMNEMRNTRHFREKRNYTENEITVAVTDNYSEVSIDQFAKTYSSLLDSKIKAKFNEAGAKKQVVNEMLDSGFLEREIILGEAYSRLPKEDIDRIKEEYKKIVERCKEKVDEEKKKVISLGGLCVIGTERHDSRRIDDQLRGRSGRQGDPGTSIFFISAEDDMIRIFANDTVQRLLSMIPMDEDTPIELKLISSTVERAQKRLEGLHFSSRKTVLQYDDVNNQQRKVIYKERNRILDSEDIHSEILGFAPEYARNALEKSCGAVLDVDEWDFGDVNDKLGVFFDFEQPILDKETVTSARQACDILTEKLVDYLNARLNDTDIPQDEVPFGEAEKYVLLREIDRQWIDHINALDELRQGVGLQSIGQHDPLMVYKKEAYEMFEKLNENIAIQSIHKLIFGRLRYTAQEEREELNLTITKVKKGKNLRAQGDEENRPLTEKEKKQLEYAKKRMQRKEGKNNK